ncbi:GntR family transcriptional regulator [Pseudogemmobacter humi]|uniref:HTH-type transcriptional regulator McbR n=1 Tax=Pseudogemmobacter humi TaxID=2483812 RepID=A0A3P5X3D8_9RHOB|nr:GntR family transcriptional regulator [Pseudogemmobacter humi]VDC22677.1 HTH-type transcriptional regulator McbR [Pseudogemmobacter humi]
MPRKSSENRSGDDKVTALCNALREAIIFGRYRPREHLVEEELNERFGATRHTIRSAFVELDRMGLVERRPNKGVIVRDFSIGELEELYEMREILQREVAARVPMPAAPEFIAELRRLNAAYLAAAETGDKEESSRINTDFHSLIHAASGNRFLVETLDQFWLRTSPIHWFALGDSNHLRNSYEDHNRMIDALERGDRERFIQTVTQHMYPALEAYKRVNRL